MAELAFEETGRDLLRVCAVAQVPIESGLRVELSDSRVIAVFRSGGEYFASDDLCTHGNASLAEGEVTGDEIECPFHFGAFSLRTGKAIRAPCRLPLKIYPVVERGGYIYIRVERIWPSSVQA